MKIILLLLLTLIGNANADDWSKADGDREKVYLMLHTIDWAQTRYIVAHPDYYEQNKYLGRHPTRAQVNVYFGVMALAHVGVARLLPKDWRSGFQYVTIGVEAGAVVHNYSIGIKIPL